MGSFSLEVGDEMFDRFGEQCLVGRITLGQFSEDIFLPLTYWSKSDYLMQWEAALRCISEGATKSALLVSMYDPGDLNFVFAWPLYRIDQSVHVRNCIIFADELKEAFNPDNVSDYVHDREQLSEDGERISEWTVTVSDIQEFLDRRSL